MMMMVKTAERRMGGGGGGFKILFIYLFIYFEQYLFSGAQVSEAGLNGALMKRKKQHKKQ